MSRKSRKRAKMWNEYICPAIEMTVQGIVLAAFLFGLPILAILIFG